MAKPTKIDCPTAATRINAWFDGELVTDDAAALEAHLAGCDECRALAEAIRGQDADLTRAFEPGRAAARRVAAAVTAELGRERAEPSPAENVATGSSCHVRGPSVLSTPQSRAASSAHPELGPRPRTASGANVENVDRRWPGLLLAAAAGFILALILFPPWKRSATEQVAGSPSHQNSAPEPVARLVVATGQVQVLSPGTADWKTNRAYAPAEGVYLECLVCPSDGVVRTAADARCEWKTAAGCVVRLNGNTQVRFTSAGTVEVQKGQIACISPMNGSLKVVVPERGPTTAAAAAAPVTLLCEGQSTALANVAPDGGVQVTSAAGEVNVQTRSAAAPLKQGESARLVKGEIVELQGTDPILAAGWTGALLARKGYDDAELAERVDQLLARVGQAKLSHLYEEEIRALGEHACLPLVKFVESPTSLENPNQRHTAIRILADLAPTWLIGDLVRLLADADAEVRYNAAGALKRLTGTDQGREPKQWREDLKACEPTIELWRQWWRNEQDRFPPRKTARPEA